MLSDPIADMLTRIRNASAVFKKEVFIPFSKQKEEIAKILSKEGYLKKFKVSRINAGSSSGRQNKKLKNLVVELKYEKGKAVISGIERVSRPGLKVYLSYKRIPQVLSGFGITVISTSKGLMTGKQAKKKRLGGELICKVW